MARNYQKAMLATRNDADWKAWVERQECPICGADESDIERLGDEETYVDDEDKYLTQYGPRYMPYRTWSCGACGAQWRELLGPLAVHVTQDADIDLE